MNFKVLTSSIKFDKIMSKTFTWEATCNYIVYSNDGSTKLHTAVAYGKTKQDTLVDVISAAYRDAINVTTKEVA
jgi:hypothetical protein